MHDPFPPRYRLLAVTTYSAYSRDAQHPDQDCQLYLIPSTNPSFIPSVGKPSPFFSKPNIHVLHSRTSPPN